jgi:serine/threonine protein kinase
MPMTPELWQRVSAALDHVATLPADQVEDYLDRLADGEPEVAEQVLGLYHRQDPRLSERLERLPGHHAGALRQRLAERLETGSWKEPAAPSGATPYPYLTPPEAPGELGRLGGYRVLRVLGEGGMGVVFEAEEQRPLRRVALKVMKSELAGGEQARRRFLREGQAAATVEHERVVPVFRVDEAGGVPFLVMPLLPGESLEARLKREQRLPLAEVLRVGREAAEGLAAAHHKGLVHRDVKPANIWLRQPGGSVVLLDFGLARPWQGPGLTGSRQVLGTLSYMSPEQAAGEPVDHRSDLFSLGCVLYRLCTGRLPFGGAGVLDTTEAEALGRLRTPAEIEASVPAALSELVMRLLAWKPADRPASAEAVAQALRELEGIPLAPTPSQETTVAADPRATARPSRWRALAAAAVLLLSVAAFGGWWLAGGDKPTRSSEPPPQFKVSLPFQGSVDILVYRVDPDGGDGLYPLSDRLAMPLRPGDKFRIDAGVQPPGYLYLFWIDEAGKAVPVYPWKLGEWGTRPDREERVGTLKIQSARGKALAIIGDAKGMETVLMLARDEPLDASEEEVRGWFAGLPALPFRSERALAWFENFDLLRHDPTRGFIDVDVQDERSPLGLQATLARRIGTKATYSRAITFARLGRKEGP